MRDIPTPPTVPELLAPAGEPAAGYAALHYGADAVYLGLERFSARAEAVNFSPEALGEFVAFAHALRPGRKVYLTLNTLVKEKETRAAIETLLAAAERGVDAVIVQDLGIASLVKRYFPGLKLHASTQMAIHSLDGAKAARDLGYDRVTLARELTLAEIEAIAANSGVEVEVFIHGALCYSYSGLCLYSSMLNGRSGNRGRCSYPCRESVVLEDGGATVHPFSLKDLALGEKVLNLAEAGVASLKIEGRKKSPLYVATVVDYYRKLLNRDLSREEGEKAVVAMRSVFSRPWTDFFHGGVFNPDVADLDVVGHRGAPLGEITDVAVSRHGREIRFTAKLPVELHDGIQIDVPGQPRPFGFPVNDLFVYEGKTRRKAFAAPPGAGLAVVLPEDAPVLEPGQQLYLASSQLVKRSYQFPIPKSGLYSPRQKVDTSIIITCGNDSLAEEGRADCRVSIEAESGLESVYAGLAASLGMAETATKVTCSLDRVFPAFPARDEAGAEKAVREAFSRLGESRFESGKWRFSNTDKIFIKSGNLNALRRELLRGLQDACDERRSELREKLMAVVAGGCEGVNGPEAGTALWSLFADDPRSLVLFTEEDFGACHEVMVGIDSAETSAVLETLVEKCGRNKIRLALPLLIRGEEQARLRKLVDDLLQRGWRKWLVRGLGGWEMVKGDKALDLTADWPLYVLNHVAAMHLREAGFSAITLSPEDDLANQSQVARSCSSMGATVWTVVYADLPLFISAACVHAHVGKCLTGPGDGSGKRCGRRPLRMRSRSGGLLTAWPASCGTIVTGDKPYSALGQLTRLRDMGAAAFRVDLSWRPYDPSQGLEVWRGIRNGELSGTRPGNLLRGLA